MKYNHSLFSDKGPRPENQDSIAIETHPDWCVACIADGVGGAEHGREAAQFITDYFTNTLAVNPVASLYDVVTSANTELLNAHGEGFVTTFSGILIKGLELQGVHVGDTRVYILRGNGIKQLTEDHTEFFRFCLEGKLTPEEAATYPRKHVLENALGSKANPRIDTFSFKLEQGDRIILTTDGTHAFFMKHELRDMSIEALNVDSLVAGITKHVQHIKPTDNYSVIALEVNA
jgi:protein phosphatase